jgi:hypothetical protein
MPKSPMGAEHGTRQLDLSIREPGSAFQRRCSREREKSARLLRRRHIAAVPRDGLAGQVTSSALLLASRSLATRPKEVVVDKIVRFLRNDS